VRGDGNLEEFKLGSKGELSITGECCQLESGGGALRGVGTGVRPESISVKTS